MPRPKPFFASRRGAAAAAFVTLLLTACAAGPDRDARDADGTPQLHQRIAVRYRGAYRRPPLDNLIDRVLDRLTTAAGRLNGETAGTRDDWRVTIIDTPGLQSFSGPDLGPLFPSRPGAHIYLSRGLLAFPGSEGELAALIAHEMAHRLLNHDPGWGMTALFHQLFIDGPAEDPTEDPRSLWPLWWPPNRFNVDSYTAGQEEEADASALRLLTNAGYAPEALVRVQEKLTRYAAYRQQTDPSLQDKENTADPTRRGQIYQPASLTNSWTEATALQRLRRIDANHRWSVLDRHPVDDDRLDSLRKEASRFLTPVADTPETYLKAVDGIGWGDIPGRGHLFGRHVVFPARTDGTAGFRFSVPPGFALFAGSRRIGAVQGHTGTLILFDLAANPQHLTARQYINRGWGGMDQLSRQGPVRKLEVPGADGATVATTLQTPQGAINLQAAAVPLDEGRIARFIGLTPAAASRSGEDGPEEDKPAEDKPAEDKPAEDKPAKNGPEENALVETAASFRRLNTTQPSGETAQHLAVVRSENGETVARLAARMGHVPDAARLFRILNGIADGQEPATGQRLKIISND